eukprot:CAMPEP_0114370108 /NCGR_PEP_ID=MMETSP0101-20121206/32231_1 /TAXON_ID=38822 ORGANISM="Pteridomonas danica, Strain PT" /NCGR_SAMPLE_ID=MMETSP0101 /ASSEMBLY_ACC=CAM_ASM_000211 /LENGTH=193 /DNA_ID=CAMNT_0001521409 /DNA_START=84 /DNA_END=662 /DNA_ORIENTATION=+
MEGRQINTSLLALKEVIRAMQSGGHAPFRQSRLTQVLEESLTGKQCKTVVIACVSAAAINCQHTINTLRYGAELRTTKASGSQLDSFSSSTGGVRRNSVKAEQRGDAESSLRGRSRSMDTVKGSTSSNKIKPNTSSRSRQAKASTDLEAITESSELALTSSNLNLSQLRGKSPRLNGPTSSADDVSCRKNAYA